MTSNLDELLDDELEESLLWTDGEEDGVINDSDEELLLSDSVYNRTITDDKTTSCIDNNLVNKLVKSNVDNEKVCDQENRQDNNSAYDDTIACDLEDVVDLDVTLNTRTFVEEPVNKSQFVPEREMTLVEEENTDVAIEQIDDKQTDEEPTVVENNELEYNISDGATKNIKHDEVENYTDIEESDNVDHVPNVQVPKTDHLDNDEKAPQEGDKNPAGVDGSETATNLKVADNDLCVGAIDRIKPDSVEAAIIAIKESCEKSNIQAVETDHLDTQGEATNNADRGVNDVENGKLETPMKVAGTDISGGAVGSIKQDVAKRAKSSSGEGHPPEKRLRSIVQNLELDQINLEGSSQNLVKTSGKTSVTSNDSPEPNRKRSIVSFNFKNYAKNKSFDPYECEKCSLKFKDDLKFESHLIACHAMSLVINDFDIDLHQYYKQKKEKVIAQCKSTLPKLTSQDGDAALIKEYNQNVKLYPAQKNAQYFCKICENVYSTKNLIIGHLKSPKHILRRAKHS